MDKAAMLQQILEANPQDAFARYGLAMEYAGKDDFSASLSEFDRLLSDNPEYVPGYFMAAQTLARAGRPAEAKQHLQTGILAAVRTGNKHAQSEMQAMLDELELGT
jgi:cytochrome c-type biogenesis protein CcmH/NrfG